jgi:hypothetical protein
VKVTQEWRRWPVAAAVVALSFTGCDSALGLVRGGRQLGVIAFYSDPIVIEVPDTVRRGQDFTVRVRTYGGGCISQGPTEVEVAGLRATVTPYDIDSGSGFCTSELRLFQHAATIRFDRAGDARVVVRGTRQPGDRPVAEERTVIVL